MSKLLPVHHSLGGVPRTPHAMESIKVPPEVKDGLTKVALDIFVDCCNAGQPFQQALLAVYLSGIEHATEARTGGGDE